jgi:type 1 glutamine amidotransferase
MSTRALVLCDDYWHPARIARSGLGALPDSSLAFDWLEDAGDWSAQHLAAYPLVVLAKANNVSAADQRPWVTPEVEQALREHVRRGNGLLVVHSGTAGYDKLPVLRGLLGGVFIRHPPQCPVTVEPLPDHPLTAGSTPFTLLDEHYVMALDDAQADLFLRTLSEHGEQPGGWTRAEGTGRVCVLTPGHNLEVWLHPSYQALLGNALRWCSFTYPYSIEHID